MVTRGESFKARYGMKFSTVYWLIVVFCQTLVLVIAVALMSFDVSRVNLTALTGIILVLVVLSVCFAIGALYAAKDERKPIE